MNATVSTRLTDGLAALLWAAMGFLSLGLLKGCSAAGGSGNDNETGNGNDNVSTFLLEDAVADIVTDLQRAFDCGDLNPPLLAEQVTDFLESQYEQGPPSGTFEEFVQEQVQFYQDRADLQCALNTNLNQN